LKTPIQREQEAMISHGVTRKHWSPVRGPPLRTGSMDYLRTGPRTTPTDPSTDHPQNRIKNKNKDLTYCFSDRSLVSAKFRALSWESVTALGSVSGTSFIIAHCHFLCCGYKYEWKTGKSLGSLEIWAASSAFPSPFCSAHSLAVSWTRPRLHNFLNRISIINKLERPKITCFAARLSHKQKVKTFRPFAIGISSPQKQLLENDYKMFKQAAGTMILLVYIESIVI